MTMTHRERFRSTMLGRPVDRVPLYDFNFWRETIPAWHRQGLGQQWNHGNAHRYFGLDASLGGGEDDAVVGFDLHAAMHPRFELQVLEQDEQEELVRDHDGVLLRRSRHHESIPMYVGHTLTDRASWKEHYLPRLQADTPGRFRDDIDQQIQQWMAPDDGHVRNLGLGSLFGYLRNWMGLEAFSLVAYDDPAWFGEMVETLANLACTLLERLIERGARFDMIHLWEDMACQSGPLLNPMYFEQFIKPQYARIAQLATRADAVVVMVDCDGWIDTYIPHWLEAGVQCMMPVEIGNWADPVAMRKRYGPDLKMMGGFDKSILADSPQAIDREIVRLTPLVESGGFIPFCDHRVPPGVPLVHYEHYCRQARHIWGQGINLMPAAMEGDVVAGAMA